MKNSLLLLLALFILNACTREETFQGDIKPHTTNIKSQTTNALREGRDVCGSVSSIKLVQKKEADGTTTITTEYSVKNCTNIVPITIYLDVTNRNTNQQVRLFSNLPFSSKIPWTGLNPGDFYQFTVFVLRNDTQEVIDAQEQFASIQ